MARKDTYSHSKQGSNDNNRRLNEHRRTAGGSSARSSRSGSSARHLGSDASKRSTNTRRNPSYSSEGAARSSTTGRVRSLRSSLASNTSSSRNRSAAMKRTIRRDTVSSELSQRSSHDTVPRHTNVGFRVSSRHEQSVHPSRASTRRGLRNDRTMHTDGIPADVLKNPMHGYRSRPEHVSKAAAAAHSATAAISWIWNKSKVLTLLIVLVVLMAVGGSVDAVMNMNRIYQGVSVGGIDLSGKTVDEATALIAQEYEPRVSGNTVVLCENEQIAQQSRSSTSQKETLDEQISYEESLASRDRWTVNAQHIGATFDPALYAEMAYQVGRDDGWFFRRFQAQTSGITIEPECTFNETSFDELRDEIIAALGTKMVNFNIAIENAHATVTDGHDGYEVPEEWLLEKLNKGFLSSESESCYVVTMEDVPVQVNADAAQETAKSVNASLPAGARFVYENAEWFADADELASWIYTEVQSENDQYALVPLFDETKASKAILNGFQFAFVGTDYTVQFTNMNGEIMVNTNATGAVPQVRSAIAEMNSTFFDSSERSEAPTISIVSAEIPEEMTFDEARDYGLVVPVSSFTTQYASGATARNNNIHVAADYLNDSICKAGETWSFLALSGETTADKGYQDAGAIVSGEYSDAIGGGICQVATTVFNAVYEAGYPIEKRYNHSLYIASYPEGRDAAIAYPDMDLIWSNDTDSDVLLVMSYTNSSVTATLYGVDPGYEVTTTYGEWQEGEPFKTVVRQDPDWPVGKEFVETQGTDGRSITIVRTVKDMNGNIIREKEFHSNYRPKNKVIVQGTAQ